MINNVLARLGNPLDRNEAERGILLLVLVAPLYLQFDLWAWYMVVHVSMHQYIHAETVHRLLPLGFAFFASDLALVVLGLALRQRTWFIRIFPTLVAQFYAVTMSVYGYAIGSLSFIAGVVIAAAPIVGFIIFERRTVYWAYATALVMIFGGTYAAAEGYIPYGPVFVNNLPAGTHGAGLFWVNSMAFFTFNQIACLVALSDFVVFRWRRRELYVKNLSLIDPLTGVSNRRSIMDQLDREVARTARHGPPLVIVMLDLDHFKQINDTWGHPAGDKVLQSAVETIQLIIRKCDMLGRYGGEEFLLILPETTLEGAGVLVERCRAQLEKTPIMTAEGKSMHISASFGLVSNESCLGVSAQNLIKAADEALYRAKRLGRNRVEMADLHVASKGI